MVLHHGQWVLPVGVHLPKTGVFLTGSGSARTDYLNQENIEQIFITVVDYITTNVETASESRKERSG